MPDPRLIERYVAGECTLPERVVIQRWIAVNPNWGDALAAMRCDSAHELAGREESIDERAETQQLFARVGLQNLDNANMPENGWAETASAPSDVRRVRNAYFGFSVRRIAYGVAATGLCLVIAAVTVLGWARSAEPTTVPVSTYTTGNGERATIKLPDGSTVVLNVASRLEVPIDYLEGHRALRLEGEARFSVVAQSDAPFTVESGKTVTRVLGTRFVVRHYETDPSTMVAVHDGKVAVNGAVLTGAQRAEIFANGETIVSRVTDMDNTFADGVLILRGALLSDAITDLNRWYDVDVRIVDSSLATRRLDAKLDAGSPSDLQTILELTFGVRVVRDGRVLSLYSGR